MGMLFPQIVAGLSNGSILLLAALGLSLTFGQMGVINNAHGEFMMAGAYTLSKNNMVRGDVLYGFFPPRLQAGLDLTLYFIFFLPGVCALIWAGYLYAGDSWAIWEHSGITANGPPVYHFKTVIPVAGSFLLLQGIVKMIRCIRCLKEGQWPSREQDVEEVDVEKLKAQMHVKDEDIAKLDEYVTSKKGGDR